MTKVRIKPRILDVIEDDGMWLDKSTMTYYSKEDVEEVDLFSDLDDAAEEFAEGEWDGLHDDDGDALYTQDYIEYTFKAGADWQKNQILNWVKEKQEQHKGYSDVELVVTLKDLVEKVL